MKKRKIIAGSVLGVLLVIYVGVSIYFTNRFLPGTKLNDRKVAGYTAEKIKSEITDEIHSYVLTIKEREKKEETIAGSDIDLEPPPQHCQSLISSISKPSAFAEALAYSSRSFALFFRVHPG